MASWRAQADLVGRVEELGELAGVQVLCNVGIAQQGLREGDALGVDGSSGRVDQLMRLLAARSSPTASQAWVTWASERSSGAPGRSSKTLVCCRSSTMSRAWYDADR